VFTPPLQQRGWDIRCPRPKEFSGCPPLFNQRFDLLGPCLEQLVATPPGLCAIFCAERNTHPFAAPALTGNAEVRPPGSVVVPHVVVGSVILVAVKWEDPLHGADLRCRPVVGQKFSSHKANSHFLSGVGLVRYRLAKTVIAAWMLTQKVW
jgi:hypothetical protein